MSGPRFSSTDSFDLSAQMFYLFEDVSLELFLHDLHRRNIGYSLIANRGAVSIITLPGSSRTCSTSTPVSRAIVLDDFGHMFDCFERREEARDFVRLVDNQSMGFYFLS